MCSAMRGSEICAGRGRVPVNSIACCHNAAVGFRSLLAPGKPIKRAKAFITAGRAPLPATYKFPCSNMARQNCESNASVAVRFRPESQSESDAADNSDGDTSNYATGEVRKRDHWATLLTTMPNLSSRNWAGRLGEFITHTGPSTSSDKVSATGSILHLWKANVKETETRGGDSSEVDLPESVAINYYTAEGISVTEKASPAAATIAGSGGGAAGQGASSGANQQSGVFVWDQKELGAKPTGFVFSPEAPQLSLTLSGWQEQAPVLYRVLRLLPLSSSGVAIVNAALPDSFGPAAADAQPAGSYWFFEVLLTHPDAAEDWQASTLGIAYDWSTGELSSHRYSWQKVTETVEPPPDDISRVTVRAVTKPTRDSSAELAGMLSKLSSQTQLEHEHTVYSYSNDEHQKLMRKTHTGTEAPEATDAIGAVEGQFSISNFLKDPGYDRDKGLVTLWFPHGGMYARVPAQLPGKPGSETDAAAGGGEVMFEIGAIHGDGLGLSRCVLVYESGVGENRLQRVENDEWTAPMDLKTVPDQQQ